MQRYDVINRFIKERFDGRATYLEIGLNKSDCFNRVQSNNKVSVDPNPNCKASYVMTSDDFFASQKNLGRKWDIIFIDGLHIADQVYRDIQNSLEFSSENAVILLHDCSPPTWQHAHSDWETFSGSWTGSVWKAIYYTRTNSSYLTYTIDTDFGIGVIDKTKTGQKIEHTNMFFDFGLMKSDRERQLGLISLKEFMQYSLM